MTANEIRRIHVEGDRLEPFKAAMLQEIAAQLAELNEHLAVFGQAAIRADQAGAHVEITAVRP